jgi:signal peptidase II
MRKWLGLAIFVAALDQAVKYLVTQTMQLGDLVPVLPFLSWVRWHNEGAAFSMLSDAAGWQRWFFVVLAVAICIWLFTMLRHHQHERALPLSFSLIIGGAVGNVIDRLVHGAVVDFLYFHIGRYGWPAFNIADSAITIGVVLMLWSQFRPSSSPPAKENAS